jgi:hypothetical protein
MEADCQKFVPIAGYWLEPARRDELYEFVELIDSMLSRVRSASEDVVGFEIASSLPTRQATILLVELGIWSQIDSSIWYRCLQTRRHILSEGGTVESVDMGVLMKWMRELAQSTRC